MKTIALLVLFLTAVHANAKCGGTCIGTNNNPYYNSACEGASVNGQQACEKYSGLGCVWRAKTEMPGTCVGTSNNPYYNQACEGASVNGERACERYSGLGCLWQPPTCQ